MPDTQPVPPQIDVRTLDAWRREGRALTLVDVREPWEWELCRIDGALHIPMGELADRVDDLPEDRPVVMVCHIGGRSGQATLWLRSRGFDNVTNLSGGVEAWALEIDPQMRRY